MKDLTPLQSAMAELNTAQGKMDFRGKAYATVAMRVELLRKHLGFDVSLTTEIIQLDEKVVIMKATATDAEGRVLATGIAEEFRSGKGVNSTSAVENCETSAWGRCLGNLGLVGGELCSADELTTALNQQKANEGLTKRKDNLVAKINSYTTLEDLSEFAQSLKDPEEGAGKAYATLTQPLKNDVDTALRNTREHLKGREAA